MAYFFGEDARVEVLRARGKLYRTRTFVNVQAYDDVNYVDREIEDSVLCELFDGQASPELAARVALAAALGLHPNDVSVQARPGKSNGFTEVQRRKRERWTPAPNAKYKKTYATVIACKGDEIIVRSHKDWGKYTLKLRWRNGYGSHGSDFGRGTVVKLYERPGVGHVNFRRQGS